MSVIETVHAENADEPTEAASEAPILDSVLEGRLDVIQDGRAYGWAWDRNHPEARLDVELRVEDADGRRHILGRAKADRLREDLKGNGIGDGCYAFEAEVSLPAGLAPEQVVAVVTSPGTGAETTLVQPNSDEKLIERTLVPHLARIGGAIGVLRRDQQQAAAIQQGIARAVRDIQKSVASQGEDHAATLARIDALGGEIKNLQERIDGIEVFLVRFDTALHAIDNSVKQAKAAEAGRLKFGLAATACGMFVVLAGGLALAGGLLG